MKSSWPLSLEHFDLHHDESERNVSDRSGSYKGLSSEALFTSLIDLKIIFNHPLVHGTFMDLGCGNARTVLYYAWMFPERLSMGMEYEESRLQAARKYLIDHSMGNVTLIHGDLLRDEIPEADTYFLYFPTGFVLDRVLDNLYNSNKPFRIVAIESHGDLLPRLDLENWLTLKAKIQLDSQRHTDQAFIYERNSNKRDSKLLPFSLSFIEKHFFIRNKEEVWIGESFGMEWTYEDRFELSIPPRTIHWNEIIKICDYNQMDEKYCEAVRIRRLGEVDITTETKSFSGHIRKIIIEPTFRLELSGGETVEWDRILTIHRGSKLCYDSLLD